MIDFDKEPSYYATVPANVRYDRRLPMGARLLFGEITSFMDADRRCWGSDEYLSDLYEVDLSTVQRWLKSLEETGYIERDTAKVDSVTKRYIKVNMCGLLPQPLNEGEEDYE